MNRLAQDQSHPAGTGEGAVAPAPATPSGRPGKRLLARSLRRAALAAAALAAILLLAGFVGFAERVATTAPPADPHADAIVVLTGGAERIDQALRLLAAGHASRLLISGVNPDVPARDLVSLVGDDLGAQLECCVDLGRDAIDTVSNAVEARQWTDMHGFSSLIVVTSNYHMPRSMTELAGAMPGIRLTPFPVSNPDLHLAEWWRDRTTLTLLLREYGKYLVAKARQFLPAADAGNG